MRPTDEQLELISDLYEECRESDCISAPDNITIDIIETMWKKFRLDFPNPNFKSPEFQAPEIEPEHLIEWSEIYRKTFVPLFMKICMRENAIISFVCLNDLKNEFHIYKLGNCFLLNNGELDENSINIYGALLAQNSSNVLFAIYY